jgi:PAS domain S-box-containing protein
MIAALPANETQRLKTLRGLRILDTPPEPAFDEIAQLAAGICGVPFSMISLVDFDRQWFKARVGLEICETPRDVAICAHALDQGSELLEVEDARSDARFRDNPLVAEAPFLRFYAGAPLLAGSGVTIGTLCVADTVPHRLTPLQKSALSTLGRHVVAQLKLRHMITRQASETRKLRKAKATLRQSEEKYRSLVERMHEVVFRLDSSGRLTYLNKSWSKITGRTVEASLGQRYADFVAPEHRNESWDRFTSMCAKGQGYRAELPYRDKNGGERWGLVDMDFERDDKGRIRGAFGTVSDITDRKRAEETLSKSEQQHRFVLGNLKEVVFQTDTAGLWTYLNPAWTEITGFPVVESLGTSFLQYVHPDDRERNTRLFGPLIERKKDYCRHEVRYLTKSGGFCWIEVFAKLALDEHDQIVGTAGTLYDISERKNAEEALKRQQAAVEAAIDGVAIYDEAGCFSHLNSTKLAMFGYEDQAELLGKSWTLLYPPSEISRFEQEILPALARNGHWRGRLTGLRRNGSVFTEEVSLAAIEGGGRVAACRDITDRLQSEERIKNSLEEKELMLKEIHHRVKNNLQIVSSLLNLQLDYLPDDASRARFVESQRRIASMALVHEKLYRSHDLAHVDFTDYLRDLTDNLVSGLGGSAREIRLKLDVGDLWLTIDTAIPCGLIVNELVINAFKHGFPGGGPGNVTLAMHRTDERRLRLEVADDGCGIPQNFDLRRSKSLGMQLVFTLVRQLRGSISVRNESGARFELEFPEAERK